MARRARLLVVLLLGAPYGALCQNEGPPIPLLLASPPPARFRFLPTFLLTPTSLPQTPVTALDLRGPQRLFHQQGDPDSLFTFGKPTPHGELRVKMSFEVNDVVLKSIAPDLRVDPASTRSRLSGDYRALDAEGRPYQFRLGARLVW